MLNKSSGISRVEGRGEDKKKDSLKRRRSTPDENLRILTDPAAAGENRFQRTGFRGSAGDPETHKAITE